MKKFSPLIVIVAFTLLWPAAVSAAAERDLLDEIRPLQKTAASEEEARLAGLIVRGLQSYESLNDYKALFEKRERKDGVLGDAEKIYLKFEKPWKIYMGWLNTDKKGLQVVYERGRNDNKLVIHKPGLFFGLVPVVYLEQDSPWVREGSAEYNIEDAGIGTFLFDFSEAVIDAWRKNRLQVEFTGKEAQAPGPRAQVTFLDSEKNETYFAYRISVVFHEETSLPVEMELYDWDGELTGVYAYRNLKWNVGGRDREFENQINRHLLKIYNDSQDRAAGAAVNFAAKNR